MYKKQELELSCIHSFNQQSFVKFVIKHVISALARSKATEKITGEENRDKEHKRTVWQSHLPMPFLLQFFT
jgi:hypothetical protein